MMYSRCPKCNIFQNQEYLGVSCSYPKYFKIFKCQDCEVFYTQEKIKEESNTKPQLLKTRKVIPMLKSRTPCVRCQAFKRDENIKRPPIDRETSDYEYIYVVYTGNHIQKNGEVMNRFYCKNHKKSHLNYRYQFRKKDQKRKIIKLNTFIEESTSNNFYKKLHELYKNTNIKHAYRLEKYMESFEIAYDIGLHQTTLAKIFHTSQSTISRYISEKGLTREHELCIKKTHNAIFLTRVHVDNETIRINKRYWEKYMKTKNLVNK